MDDGLKPPSVYYPGIEEKKKSLGEYLDELCAYFMAIGMPWQEIMYGERAAFDDYVLAYEYKKAQQNQMLHLQGFYDYMAVSCSLSAAFAEKGKKGTPYPSNPIPITDVEREAEKQRNIEKTLKWVKDRKRNA